MQATERGGPEEAWTADLEAPEADAAEQHREVIDDDIDPEAAVGTTAPAGRAGALLGADEADVAEQAREVPLDDEERP